MPQLQAPDRTEEVPDWRYPDPSKLSIEQCRRCCAAIIAADLPPWEWHRVVEAALQTPFSSIPPIPTPS